MKKIRVRAIIEHEGKHLVTRNSYTPDFWCLPGGGVEENEDIVSALKREIVEETGINPIVGDILYIHQFKENGEYNLPEFFFEVTNGADFSRIQLENTTHGKQEIAEIGFKDITKLQLLPSFLKTDLLSKDKKAPRIHITN